MNNTEILKEEYALLKSNRKALLSELASAPKDSLIEYEIRQELTFCRARIAEIHHTLMAARFGRFYPTTIIENFFDGPQKGSR